MKAETKAKRRFTLSISGLGFLDESEIESVPGAQIVEEEAALTLDLSKMPQRPADAPRPTPAQAVANMKKTVDQKPTSKDPATPASNLPNEPFCDCSHRLSAHAKDGQRLCLDPKCACNGFWEKGKEAAAPGPETPQGFNLETWKAAVEAATSVKDLLANHHFEKIPSEFQTKENIGFFLGRYHKVKGKTDAKAKVSA